MSHTNQNQLILPRKDFKHDQDQHLSNARTIEAWASAPKDSLALIDLDELPATSDYPAGAIVRVNGVNYTNGTSGWRAFLQSAGCRVQTTGVAGIPSGGFYALGFGAALFDTDEMWDIADSGKVYIKTPGTYIVTAWVGWDGNATGHRTAAIYHNGSLIASTQVPAVTTGGPAGTELCVTQVVVGAVNDYFQLAVYQLSGGSLNIGAGRGTLAVSSIGA